MTLVDDLDDLDDMKLRLRLTFYAYASLPSPLIASDGEALTAPTLRRADTGQPLPVLDEGGAEPERGHAPHLVRARSQ